MLYPIWQPLPRPPHFPQNRKLDRLLDNYDPEVGYFKLFIWRREARDLQKGLFGSKGVRDVPRGRGARRFKLPGHWVLRLTYYETHGAGEVTAEFLPPTMGVEPPIPPE